MACRESNDSLLPILMTFLNSPDWQLRADFFSSASCLRHFTGAAGVEAYLLPCLLQVPVLAWACRFSVW